MSIRLDDGLADDLETVAAVDGKPMSDVIRQAVADHVNARRADPGFKAVLRARVAKQMKMLGDDDG